MGTHALVAGTKFELQRKFFTLTRRVSDTLWQAEESRSLRVHEFRADALRRSYAKGELTFLADGMTSRPAKPDYVDPTDERFGRAHLRLKYIKALEGLPGTRRVIEPIIRETWESLKQPLDGPPCAATVMRWRSSYRAPKGDEQRGHIRTLFDQIARRGNRKSPYDGEVQEIIEKAIAKRYLCRERGTIQDATDEAAAQVARVNERLGQAKLPIPTYRCVRRHIEAIPEFDQYAARHGRDAAIRKFRGVRGHTIAETPLARAEIDHTIVDLTVVDEETGMPLGRPYITACLDSRTRCVLGIHISFEPPSYLTVARALKHAILPKDGLREKFKSIKNDWVAYGIPYELAVDNGPEFHSEALRNAGSEIGCDIVLAPRATPMFKGRIERFLGTLNRGVAHKAPGTNFANIFERGDYDAAGNAVVGYAAFEEAVYLWICDVYHQKCHSALQMPPVQAWRDNICDDDINLPDDSSVLDAMLGWPETHRLTHKGIEYEGLFYWSVELQDLLKEHGAKLDVEIRVDRGDLGSVVVIRPGKTGYITAPALEHTYAKGLNIWQHKVIKKFAANKLKKFDSTGWREAKLRLAELFDEECVRQGMRTRKRLARFKGDAALKRKATLDTSGKTEQAQPEARHNPTSEIKTGAADASERKDTRSADPGVDAGVIEPNGDVQGGSGTDPEPRKVFKARVRARLVPPATEPNESSEPL